MMGRSMLPLLALAALGATNEPVEAITNQPLPEVPGLFLRASRGARAEISNIPNKRRPRAPADVRYAYDLRQAHYTFGERLAITKAQEKRARKAAR